MLSHESAALLWGLPRLGRWPEPVEVADARGTRPRSRNGVVWRRTPFDPAEVVELDGYLVTGLAQTLVDIACTRSFLNAVVALDAAVAPVLRADGDRRMPGVDPMALAARVRDSGRRSGARSADRAIAFADARSESVGESLSRGQMHLLGFPSPLLQVEFGRSDGRIDRVDFDWPEYGIFGEFDGDLKYLDPAFRGRRTIEEVILDEKKRADAICRRHRRRSIRWDWPIARSRALLRSTLLESGLPQVSGELPAS
ncbi:hypothetical protein [Agromyces lapidis]|uniref:Transcriptional regulator, AbiEi antitoxin, Type IV TA system n=1 Tax=Agromyces lapidis TaxID=279574 RepID=A0ABV5SKF3_9MICO|nr:hypothetical protein [Agromyces lapidis]